MKPIRVALVHHDSPRFLNERMIGMWSYDVPQFVVTHYPQADKRGAVSLDFLALKHDLIWHEDYRCWVTYKSINAKPIPRCYFVGDSTLSEENYEARRDYALDFDVVFVDWDRLERFRAKPGGRVLRCSHSVNDVFFHDYGLPKDIDVSFPCHRGGPGKVERIDLARRLRVFCAERGYVFDDNAQRPGTEYGQALNRTRLVVQLSRNAETRAHRTFDAPACRACLLTDPLPDVSDEERTPGVHYVEYHSWDELTATIDRLLVTGDWKRYADAGYELAHRHHTWARRAEQLYKTLTGLFPWLKN